MGMRVLMLLAMLLFCPSVMALAIADAEFTYTIAEQAVSAHTQFTLDAPISAHFEIPVSQHLTDLRAMQDGKPIEVRLREGFSSFDTINAERITLEYTSADLLDGESFLTSISVPLQTNRISVSLKLPPKAVLRGTDPDDPIIGAVYPAPSAVRSDGNAVIIDWQRTGMATGEELALYVKYRQSRESWLLVIIAIGILLICALGVLALRRSRTPQAAIPANPTTDMRKHLKEDEEQVVNILENREGSCEQGTLRVITGFSKAKLSVLLSELEQRKIVHREKRGKKNLVFLKKQ